MSLEREQAELLQSGLAQLERHAANTQDPEMLDLAALVRRLGKQGENRLGMGVCILQLVSIYLLGGRAIYRALALLSKFNVELQVLLGITEESDAPRNDGGAC